MEQHLSEIKVHLAEIKVDLKHHIKRTELLEKEVGAWRQDLKPIQRHVNVVNGVGALLLMAAAVGSAVAAYIR